MCFTSLLLYCSSIDPDQMSDEEKSSYCFPIRLFITRLLALIVTFLMLFAGPLAQPNLTCRRSVGFNPFGLPFLDISSTHVANLPYEFHTNDISEVVHSSSFRSMLSLHKNERGLIAAPSTTTNRCEQLPTNSLVPLSLYPHHFLDLTSQGC